MKRGLWSIFVLIFVMQAGWVQAAEMRLAVTTSFHNSGLSDILLPQIKEDIDLDVQLLVVGTGQALKLGRTGDVDAILVHSKDAEEAFVVHGYGTHSTEIMYNDFVLAGPSSDPAKTAGSTSARDAFSKIEQTHSAFISRGDDSGTNRKELTIWKSGGLNTDQLDASWYRAVGSGMGATLNIASGMNAYVMTDRASWLKFANKRDLKLLYSGDPILFNQYSYLPVNPKRHAHVNFDQAKKLEAWLVSEKAQALIGDYTIAGERLFVPNAK